jgi:hypothetical protein
MRQPDLDTLLEEAIALAQAGQNAEARPLLERIVAADPQQDLAWIWLAAVARHRDERLTFLRRALAINPANPTAQRAYQQLTGQPYASAASGRTSVSHAPTYSGTSLILLALALVVIAVIVLADYLSGDGDDEPAAAVASETLPAGVVAATATPAPSSTPTLEPLPTRTPGPSPTSLWEVPPVTWTPVVTDTAAPTRTPAPTWTPRPTRTASPTVPPFEPPSPGTDG